MCVDSCKVWCFKVLGSLLNVEKKILLYMIYVNMYCLNVICDLWLYIICIFINIFSNVFNV